MERDVSIIITGRIPSDEEYDATYELFLAELKVITLRYGLMMDEDWMVYSKPGTKNDKKSLDPLAENEV